ncbi:hypothetical protein SynA1562_00213 [Synechococcus sp. A15-62]|nr:hypothetical protein SynA1562_00213 [Synechococcus sp. A15-62]
MTRTDQATLYGLGRRQKQKYSLEQNAQIIKSYSKYRLNLPTRNSIIEIATGSN